MNGFDRLSELMGFSPKTITPEDEATAASGSTLQDTLTKPKAIITNPEPREPYVPKYGKLPMSDPRRYGLYEEDNPEPKGHDRKTYTLFTYNNDPNLEGIISKPPPPQKKTMTFTEPMTITGSKQRGKSESAKKSPIPTAQPSYGMHTQPVQAANPKPNKLQTRQNAQEWIQTNLDYLPDNVPLGIVLSVVPSEHRKAINKTVNKAIAEGIEKQIIVDWLLGRNKQ